MGIVFDGITRLKRARAVGGGTTLDTRHLHPSKGRY
jgi:hypothetical protein